MSDLRRATRVPFLSEVRCTGVGMGASPLNPRISDLSASGAFIDSMTQLPVGAQMQVIFQVNGHQVDALAEVAHSMPQFGMGVRFVALSEADQHAIAAFVGSA
jgi:hypothetical protein